MKIQPGISHGETPPFHKLDEYTFQELCRDLFDVEPGISTCEIYGTRGQAQKGIDLLAHCVEGNKIEVGQCKCYERFSANEIRKASEEFFKNWGYWSNKNVLRFILFVACDLSKTQQQDEILEQKKRFRKKGIKYEAWSANIIQNKLRPHRGIVASYLTPSDYWVLKICGDVSPHSPFIDKEKSSSLIVPQSVVDHQFDIIVEWLSNETSQKLEEMREALREGRNQDVFDWIKNIRDDSIKWRVLLPDVQAKLIRFEAFLELNLRNNIKKAKELADEAKLLMPDDKDIRLRAMIKYRECGPDEAIGVLKDEEDIDTINLEAAFLLELKRIKDCQTLLSLDEFSVKPNAETFRLLALSHLLSRDVNRAQLEIEKAFNLKPHWKSVQINKGMIEYFSALSPAAIPEFLPPWPEPVDWNLIKQDEESKKHLKNAADIFDILAEKYDEKDTEKKTFQIWYLACIANDIEQQDDAIEYLRLLLNSDPTFFPAIHWSLARRYNIELESCEIVLNKLYTAGDADIPHLIALAHYLISKEKSKEAIKIFENNKKLFLKNNAESLWISWYTKALVSADNPELALSVINESKEKRRNRNALTFVLNALTQKTKDWHQLLKHLEKSYEETQDPIFLLASCELMFYNQKWSYVVDRAEKLIKEVATGAVVRLVAISAYNEKHIDLCLRFLDQYQGFFFQNKLPGELRRLRAQCLNLIGKIPEAITEVESATIEEPSIDNLLNLAQLYYQIGDFKKLVIIARKLSNDFRLSSEQALQLSMLVKSEDRRLSIKLWRRASIQGIPDHAVVAAIDIGFQLGLDKELNSLMQRLHQLGLQGHEGIHLKKIDDLILIAKEAYAHKNKLFELYQKGTVPIHVIIDQLDVTLADIYHQVLLGNEENNDPLRQFYLLTRYGGREIPDVIPGDALNWRYHLDITAILLAEHIGILDKLEKVFKQPIFISKYLIPAMIQMQEKLTHHQPSRLAIFRDIIGLVKKGKLYINKSLPLEKTYASELIKELGEQWVSLFEEARNNRGYIVDYLPLHKLSLNGPITSLTEDDYKSIINCRTIIESLRQIGPLSEPKYLEILNTLAVEGKKESTDIILHEGDNLFCHGNIIEILADSNMLNIACERFQIFIERSELDRIQNELKQFEKNQKLIVWLNDLTDRIRQGIESGTYQIIPTSLDSNEQTDDTSIITKCLLSFLQFKPIEKDIIWIDDRCVNGYFRRDTVPIIGINDILKILYKTNVITVDEYFSKLIKLRVGNVSFIPITSEEILYHIQQGQIRNDELIETYELSVLRKYLATSLIKSNILQKPPMPKGAPNVNGEIAFIVGIGRTLSFIIVDVWKKEYYEDNNNSYTKSTWLFDNLYVDLLGLSTITSSRKEKLDDTYLISRSLEGLIYQGILLDPVSKDNSHSIRRHYFNWLFGRVLSKRFDNNPFLLQTIADQLKMSIRTALEQERTELKPEMYKLLFCEFYEDLPKPIQLELERDLDFMNTFGYKTTPIIQFMDLNFDPHEFWKVIHTVVNGKESKVKLFESDREIHFIPKERNEKNILFSFEHPNDGKTKDVRNDLFALLTNSITEREAILLRNHYWFD